VTTKKKIFLHGPASFSGGTPKNDIFRAYCIDASPTNPPPAEKQTQLPHPHPRHQKAYENRAHIYPTRNLILPVLNSAADFLNGLV